MIRQLFARSAARPAVPSGQRVYAIGDVHGRSDLFDRLLELIREDHAGRGPAEATVILLGDLIDRGPDSAGVLTRAMAPLGWARTVAIKGNHEATMLDALDGNPKMVPIWLANGGDAALRSWGIDEQLIDQGTIAELVDAMLKLIDPAVRMWISRMRQNVQIGDYYFVHAGVRPGTALDKQTVTDSMWIREEFLDSKRAHGAVVVHGHSISAEVEEMPNRIGIDTGAYSTGKLTALGLEGTSRWFVQT